MASAVVAPQTMQVSRRWRSATLCGLSSRVGGCQQDASGPLLLQEGTMDAEAPASELDAKVRRHGRVLQHPMDRAQHETPRAHPGRTHGGLDGVSPPVADGTATWHGSSIAAREGHPVLEELPRDIAYSSTAQRMSLPGCGGSAAIGTSFDAVVSKTSIASRARAASAAWGLCRA